MTYPNVLILGYLRATGKATPEVSLDAETKINLGYQRLLTFEVSGGGFDWFGRAPANVVLTGVALQEFTEMNAVYPIDLAVVDRARQWLLSKQNPDGSWTEAHLPFSLTIGSGDVAVSAHTVWSLSAAGYDGPEVALGVRWLKGKLQSVQDPYALALVANALIAADPADADGRAILDGLDRSAKRDDTSAWWGEESTSFCGGHGATGKIETTSLASLALLAGKAHLDTTSKALTFLVRSKDPQGGWPSTQATILSLKALLRASLDLAQGEGQGTVEVKVNGKDAHRFEVAAGQGDVLQLADVTSGIAAGENTVELAFTGKGTFNYQVCGRYYLPWDKAPREEKKAIDIGVTYDRTTLAKDDLLTARVKVDYLAQTPAGMVIVDLGIPPGFDVDAGSFAELAARQGTPHVDKFSITGRQVTLYVGGLEKGRPLEFEYSLRAKYPLKAKTPASTAYEYYAPDRRAEAEPVTLEVK